MRYCIGKLMFLKRFEIRHAGRRNKKGLAGRAAIQLRAWLIKQGIITPPHWVRLREYRKQHPSKWYPAYPPQKARWVPLTCYNQPRANLERLLTDSFPELGVLEIENGGLFGHPGWVFDDQLRLMPEFSRFGPSTYSRVYGVRPLSLQPPKCVKGVCLLLTSDFARVNYVHFLNDALARFHLFTKAGFTLKDVDHIYCPRPFSTNLERIFDRLELPRSKLIWTEKAKLIRADTILAPSFPGRGHNHPAWQVDFYRDVVKLPSLSPQRRLYIDRRNTFRNPTDLDDFCMILKKHDIEIYDPLADENQPLTFNQAQFVIGATGAGLINILFCQPGTQVVELVPSHHLYINYFTIAQGADLSYGYIHCETVDPSKRGRWRSESDFHVDLEILDRVLEQLLI
jgi:hypothetical protein